MTENQDETRSLAWWPLIPVGGVLYVASVGPVARFVRTAGIDRDSIPGSVISFVYWPFELLVDRIPAFSAFMRWYVELFVP